MTCMCTKRSTKCNDSYTSKTGEAILVFKYQLMQWAIALMPTQAQSIQKLPAACSTPAQYFNKENSWGQIL